MPTTISSAKGTSYAASLEAASKRLQIATKLPVLKIAQTPAITEILSVAGSESVGDYIFYHHEDELIPDTVTITTADAAAAGEIQVANDYGYIQQYDVLMNERTKHVIQIDDATIDANPLTCHTVAGTDVGNQIGDIYRRLGCAWSEGGTAPSPLMTVEVKKTWYLQKFRRTIELTKEREGTDTYHGSKRAHEVVKKSAQIKRELCMTAFFSGKSADTGAGPPVTNMVVPASAGLYHECTTNVEYNQGTLTLGEFRDILDAPRASHDSGDFTVYGGSNIMGIIDDLLGDKVKVENGTEKYGIHFTRLRLGRNTIRLVEQPLWTSEYMGQLMFIVPNPISKYMKLVHWNGEDLSWYKNILKDNNNDTIKDEIKGWMGLQFIEESRFAVIDGIVS